MGNIKIKVKETLDQKLTGFGEKWEHIKFGVIGAYRYVIHNEDVSFNQWLKEKGFTSTIGISIDKKFDFPEDAGVDSAKMMMHLMGFMSKYEEHMNDLETLDHDDLARDLRILSGERMKDVDLANIKFLLPIFSTINTDYTLDFPEREYSAKDMIEARKVMANLANQQCDFIGNRKSVYGSLSSYKIDYDYDDCVNKLKDFFVGTEAKITSLLKTVDHDSNMDPLEKEKVNKLLQKSYDKLNDAKKYLTTVASNEALLKNGSGKKILRGSSDIHKIYSEKTSFELQDNSKLINSEDKTYVSSLTDVMSSLSDRKSIANGTLPSSYRDEFTTIYGQGREQNIKLYGVVAARKLEEAANLVAGLNFVETFASTVITDGKLNVSAVDDLVIKYQYNSREKFLGEIKEFLDVVIYDKESQKILFKEIDDGNYKGSVSKYFCETLKDKIDAASQDDSPGVLEGVANWFRNLFSGKKTISSNSRFLTVAKKFCLDIPVEPIEDGGTEDNSSVDEESSKKRSNQLGLSDLRENIANAVYDCFMISPGVKKWINSNYGKVWIEGGKGDVQIVGLRGDTRQYVFELPGAETTDQRLNQFSSSYDKKTFKEWNNGMKLDFGLTKTKNENRLLNEILGEESPYLLKAARHTKDPMVKMIFTTYFEDNRPAVHGNFDEIVIKGLQNISSITHPSVRAKLREIMDNELYDRMYKK